LTSPLIVETPLILKARLLLSGVKRISNVVADMPLLSIHVASEFEPIERIAAAEWTRETTRATRNKTDEAALPVRLLGREKKRIAPGDALGREERENQVRGREDSEEIDDQRL
jgi:hypothetical protein